MEVSQNLGVPFFGCPNNKDSSILGSIFGSPYFGKLPNSGLLGYATIGYIEPRTHNLGDWSLRDCLGRAVRRV